MPTSDIQKDRFYSNLKCKSVTFWQDWLWMAFIIYLTPFASNASFLYPLKKSENCMVFWCFHRVEKGRIGNKWVNWIYSSNLLFFICRINSEICLFGSLYLVFFVFSVGFSQRFCNAFAIIIKLYNYEELQFQLTQKSTIWHIDLYHLT